MKAVFFLLVAIHLLTSDPSERSFVVGIIVIFGGLTLRIMAAGYRSDFCISGPFQFVRGPHHLGTLLVLGGLAMIGRQLDIVLMTLVLVALFLLRDLNKWESVLEKNYGGSYLFYKKVVPCFMPTILPLDADQVAKKWGHLVPKGNFSLKKSMVDGFNKKQGEMSIVFYTALILAAHYLVFRYETVVPMRRILAVILVLLVSCRWIFFAVRGERRGQFQSPPSGAW